MESDEDLVDGVVARFARERPDIDGRALETVCRIIVASRRLETRAAALLKPSGLNYTDFDILGMLRSSGPPYELQPAELIRSVMITSGSMTAAIGRLEHAGYVTRRIAPHDRRVRLIALTGDGKQVIDQALTRRFDDVAEAFSSLAPEDHAHLDHCLKKLASALESPPDC